MSIPCFQLKFWPPTTPTAPPHYRRHFLCLLQVHCGLKTTPTSPDADVTSCAYSKPPTEILAPNHAHCSSPLLTSLPVPIPSFGLKSCPKTTHTAPPHCSRHFLCLLQACCGFQTTPTSPKADVTFCAYCKLPDGSSGPRPHPLLLPIADVTDQLAPDHAHFLLS